MATVIQRAKEWLARLQRAEQQVKRRWLIGLCSVSMLMVIFFWGIYINAITPMVPLPTMASPTTAPQEAAQPGALETLFAGVGVVGRETALAVSRGIAFVKGIVGHEREISVEVTHTPENFMLESLPAIPPVRLP